MSNPHKLKNFISTAGAILIVVVIISYVAGIVSLFLPQHPKFMKGALMSLVISAALLAALFQLNEKNKPQ